MGPEVINQSSGWITAFKELGFPGVMVAASLWIVIKHVIPAWERQATLREQGIQHAHTQIVSLMERQRVDHREQVEAFTRSLNRLGGLVIALGERWGGDRSAIVARGAQISGESYRQDDTGFGEKVKSGG